MIENIYLWLGVYTFQAYNLILTYLQCFVCLAFFARRMERRSHFVLRTAGALAAGVLLCVPLIVLYTHLNTLPARVFCYLTVSLLNFLALAFCWKDNVEELLLTFCSGTAAYQLTNKLYPLLQLLRGFNDLETISLFHAGFIQWWDWALYFAFYLACYWALSQIFRPRTRLYRSRRTARSVGVLSCFTILVVNVLICISRTYEAESLALNLIVKIFCILFGIETLFACTHIFSLNERDHQIDVLHQLWRQDKAQFESVKANMDVINMKCHDLKHILGKIAGKLTTEETDSLRTAIEFYDSNIKTGNEVLDVVLCEKAMACQRDSIRFSCMADGTRLDFLTPVQTYTLFGNIIDNAIEAVRRLPDPELRVISLICRAEGTRLMIEESNYFTGDLNLNGDLPATAKDDISRHGYGTRSIQYIARQYGGDMHIELSGNMFFLKVWFPLSAAVSASGGQACVFRQVKDVPSFPGRI
ncbi:GHKL domain-containing protein [Subdoligranulum sp. DSM 109015]|uniref:GHKL domain-containing protein n=1 Tax=Gemmiger gallinarum TaxID=2779354 RepID=A0ABR9R6I5_9FIRM|nr:sensor histidine kinase [Gemmiger gallinarum]MBE5038768.1 GHKL domain-containing protein [Gemmiger gallinarum]